jgi:1-acyl-sn-glycerol-3-phosphate acyltransferase
VPVETANLAETLPGTTRRSASRASCRITRGSRRCNELLSVLARLILKLGGWTLVGTPPVLGRAVLIAAPHTSNWDGFWGFAYLIATRFRVSFFAKKSLFWFPLGAVIRALGGIPLDRERPGGAVQQAVDLLMHNDHMIFGLSPEGTRRLTGHWRTGFYRIAKQAGVPIILAIFDYANRRIGIGPTFTPTDDTEADLEYLARYYDEHGSGFHPDKVGPVRFDIDRAKRDSGYTRRDDD